MMVDFVCENNSNKLSDTSKNQICMQSPFVLSTASCETEIIFDVIDISLDYSSGFISIIPFFGFTNGSGISPKVFFGIDINHTTAFWGGTWVFAIALSVRFLGGFIINPFHLWADKFKSWQSASQMWFASFSFHRKWRITKYSCHNDV